MRFGPLLALTAALLFGMSTPIAKVLLRRTDPVLLASLLYLGSGLGLAGWRAFARRRRPDSEASLGRKDLPWLAGAVFAGGVVAPILLLAGLAKTPAATASLLLNLEGALTALIAWFLFRENFAIDNNLTGRISAADPVQIAMIKGLSAGGVNGLIAVGRGAPAPSPVVILMSLLVGFVSFGVSLTLFVRAMRLIGTARTSAYFSTAPFVGAALSLLLPGEEPGWRLAAAGSLMGAGVWLHLSERHDHVHTHEAIEHTHSHRNDEHHQHAHAATDPPGEPHSHPHRHEPITHAHPHYPDIHHRHHH